MTVIPRACFLPEPQSLGKSNTYDTENNLLTIKDALLRTTSFAYDVRGRVTTTTFPSTLTETYTYDAMGNLLTKTDRKNQTLTYTYDNLDRLTRKQYPDSSGVDYTYDNLSRLTRIVDATGQYDFSYDNLGRLTSATSAYAFLASRSFVVSYGYDLASNRTSMTDPESGSTSYSYDALNRITSLTPPSAFASGNFGFSYDDLSRRTQMTRPNSVSTDYAYDNKSRLTSLLHKLSGSTIDGNTYTVDNVGNRTAKIDMPANLTSNFSYDNIYQLTQVTQGAATPEAYTYDVVGNRLSSAGVSPYAYNSSNQLTSVPNTTYTYDSNGNTLTKTDASGTTTYSWDYENRLVGVALPNSGGTVSFTYDPMGRRIRKVFGSATTIYAYDAENIVQETDASGTVQARFAMGLSIDEPLAQLRSSTTHFYNADGLGSITSLTDSSGSVAATYVYDSFGNLTSSAGSVVNPFRYTAREWDGDLSLYHYRARYYDESAGRFLSEDQERFRAGDDNFFRYVSNSPLNYVDPSGNKLKLVLGSGELEGLQLHQILMALDYLRSDPACGAVLRKLENSPRVFTIKSNSDDDDSYDPSSRTINWDPTSGVTCTGGGRQSPALGLCHEMAHAAGDGPIARSWALTPDSQYDNREERRVIRTFETPFAIRRGEGVRHDHSGQPIRVATPTSR